jgi:hypothetical protein
MVTCPAQDDDVDHVSDDDEDETRFAKDVIARRKCVPAASPPCVQEPCFLGYVNINAIMTTAQLVKSRRKRLFRVK